MKIFLSLLISFISLLSFEGVFAEVLPAWVYQWYVDNSRDFCALKNEDATKYWGNWKNESLIKLDKIDYPDIADPNPNAKYDIVLKAIRADTGKLRTIEALTGGPDHVEKASYVYKEVMSTIYACAVLHAKVRIIGNMIEMDTKQSEITKSLKKQLERTKKSINEKGCREVVSPPPSNNSKTSAPIISIKTILLDNTTYQYCNYRQYLYYLEAASKNKMDEYLKTKAEKEWGKPASLLDNTESAAAYIAGAQGKVAAEIAHTKEVFPQALIAFTEFERTYAPHIILQFILQDYIELRTSLKQLLNPIGQVIYKASNAQSPK